MSVGIRIKNALKKYGDDIQVIYCENDNMAYGAIEALEEAGRKRGYLLARGEIHTERMAKVLLDEYRSGKLGHFTLEMPEETV